MDYFRRQVCRRVQIRRLDPIYLSVNMIFLSLHAPTADLTRSARAGHRLLKGSDVSQPINDPPAELNEVRPFTCPPPAFERPRADPPSRRQLPLVDAHRSHFHRHHLRALSLWQIRPRHNEGVGTEYYQGNIDTRAQPGTKVPLRLIQRSSAEAKFRLAIRKHSGAMWRIP
jgi:hypothetical protein